MRFSKYALQAFVLCALLSLSACGDGRRDAPVARTRPNWTAGSDAEITTDGVQQLLTNARAGDVLKVRLRDLHPTQGALGYDEVYYRLDRFERDPRLRFDSYCEDDGRGGILPMPLAPTAKLSEPQSFRCRLAGTLERDKLRPVVVGPGGNLYLTDGHHTMSAYAELPDGGLDLQIHVLVTANYSSLATGDFWRRMQRDGHAWLRNADNLPIDATALPAHVGLRGGFGNDRYRSIVFFARHIAYEDPRPPVDFIEFYWGDYLRATGFDPRRYALNRLGSLSQQSPLAADGYLNAVWTAAELIVAARAPIAGSWAPAALGQQATINRGKAPNHGKFSDLARRIGSKHPGAVALMIDYKQRHRIDD
ncbi:MAG: ParB/Srx family N-terminal domain-containing protein [Janthinobacterium lividum]